MELSTAIATQRTSRVVAMICAVGSLVYVAVMSPLIVAQWSMFTEWWLALAATVFVVFPMVAVAVAMTDRPLVARRVVRVWAPLIPITVLLMPVGLVLGSIPEPLGSPWVLHATLVGGAVSAAAWTDARGFILTGITAACVIVSRIGARADDILTIAVLDGFAALATGTVIATLIAATIRASASLDALAADVGEQTVAIATANAMTEERTRIVGDVHDGVLAVLLGATRATEQTSPAIAADAARVIARADAMHHPADSTALSELVLRLNERLTSIDPTLAVTTAFEAGPTLVTMPAEVADAMVDAMAEALRNSVAYAGTRSGAVHREVEVTIAATTVAVTISDDGMGFTPSHVDPRRLGISTSIIGRMSALTGGSATVRTVPGHGTTVELWWRSVEDESASSAGTLNADQTIALSPQLSRQLGFGSPGAIAIAVLVVATQTALAAWLASTHPVPTIAALALIAVAAALVVARGRFPMGRIRTGALVVVPMLAVALGLTPVDPNLAGGYAGWSIGAGFTLLLGACLQGRPGWASVGGLGIVLVVIAWQMLGGGSLAAVPGLVVREVALFAMGAIFTFQFRRTARLLGSLSEQRTSIAVDLARANARAEARRREFDPLIDSARPSLAMIATGNPLSVAERQTIGLLEARMRDQLRAPLLARPTIAGTVETIRRAGIDVLLIDDTGLDALTGAQEVAVAEAIRAAAPAGGSLVVRATLDGPSDGIRLSLATDDALEVIAIAKSG